MNLKDFTRGWIVGDFEPALVQTQDVEIGILNLKAGTKGDFHYHKSHIEYNLIISGSAVFTLCDGSKIYNVGDIFTFLPFEESTVEYPVDTQLLVIKSPATKGDKHYSK